MPRLRPWQDERMSPALKHTLCLLVVAAGGAVAALARAHPEYQWTGVALALIAAIGNALTESPVQAKQIAGMRAKIVSLTTALGKAMPPLATLCAVGLLALGSSGCSWLQSPQGTATETAAADLAVCVLNHITEPVQQIATDCGAAVVSDVVKIIDAHNAAEAREKAAGK